MKKKVLVLILSVLLALGLAACTQDMPAPPPSGESASGIVTLNGEGLAGVSVLVNGVPSSSTDGYGVFSLSGLEEGDLIAFAAEGYSFSPSSYEVSGTVNDLHILASLLPDDNDEGTDGDKDDDTEDGEDGETPDDPQDPDDGDAPDDGETPDGGDTPDDGDTSDDDAPDDDGETPETPSEDDPDTPNEDEEYPDEETPVETLSPAGNFLFFYTADGTPSLRFALDARTESFELTVLVQGRDEVFSGEGSLESESVTIGETVIPLSCERTEESVTATLPLTFLSSPTEGTLSVTSKAEGMNSSISETYAFAFGRDLPAVTDLSLDDGVLSWRTENAPEGSVSLVTANGVTVAVTEETSLPLTSLTHPVPTGAEIVVILTLDSKPIAYSSILTI